MMGTPSEWKNKLYFGDNLSILREHVPDESVDLIYLDPPFNSQATYNVLFGEKDGSQSQAQITAFDDTWHWGEDSEQTYREVVTEGPKKLADLVQALRSFLGRNDMMAYLIMMAPRLDELHRVLKSTGSIYLHCDPTASHYLRLLMDAVFDPRNFRNELIWKRTTAHSSARRFGPVHDVILFYSRSENYVWNKQFTPYDEAYIKSKYSQTDSDGRRFTLSDLMAAGVRHGSSGKIWRGIDPSDNGNHWKFAVESLERLDKEGRIYWSKKGKTPRYKRYLDEVKGRALQDVIEDIYPINSQAKERLGYPTQKPESLLERVINASSNEGDLVLDPFCGCGTTINVAERLKRRWIGIDITHLAIALIKNRLMDTFGPELSPYEVIGAPKDLESARALANQDRYQFEWWALSLVEARPAQDKKKGADSGIDGFINFFDDESGNAKKIIVQVKSGHVTTSQIRDLKAVVDREKAVIGAFVTLESSTKPMVTEALTAGHYVPEHLDKKHIAPKIQILTIAEILAGSELQFPRMLVGTHKRAQRKYKDQGPTQQDLL
jgi:site-specific DNA-methyltransferase (adenine-specific)